MSLRWTDSLKTGIPEIDQQHKQLIDQMNLLYDAIQNDKGSEEIKNIMTFLQSYVNQHFGYEETCMHRYKCPVATENKTAHLQFINSLNEINNEINTKGASISLAIKVNQNLLEWFINHIKKIDTQLKACMP